jgi:PAS domain-containing protein
VAFGIGQAVLAGGTVAVMLALALAAGVAHFLYQPLLRRAHQALIDRERMAQSIIDGALDAFSRRMDPASFVTGPHAEVLMGWTRAEAIGVGAEDLIFPEEQRAAHSKWVSQFLSGASARNHRRAI